MKKDDMLEITIEDISSDGSGVGKADGFALFVKDTIPGDQVKVKIMKMKKRYGYARLMEILVPSPDRIQAPCPVARQCGGCQIQQMSYERQLTFKENKVCNNLRRKNHCRILCRPHAQHHSKHRLSARSRRK